MTPAAEEWHPIPGWEGYYEASSLGRIKSLPRVVYRRNRWGGENCCLYAERILKPVRNGTGPGYLILHLSDENGRHTHSVHALVCAAFHGERPVGKQAAYGNGDPSDNRPENLRWATPAENAADKISHGRTNAGERNGAAKLTSHEVRIIRQLKAAGRSSGHLGQRFAVSPSQIDAIVAARKWKHVA